jgi:hypothetical protein
MLLPCPFDGAVSSIPFLAQINASLKYVLEASKCLHCTVQVVGVRFCLHCLHGLCGKRLYTHSICGNCGAWNGACGVA